MKIVNVDGENLHIFWTTWETSVKLSGKMWHDNIKSHKKSGITLSLEDTLLEKPQEGGSTLPLKTWGERLGESLSPSLFTVKAEVRVLQIGQNQ